MASFINPSLCHCYALMLQKKQSPSLATYQAYLQECFDAGCDSQSTPDLQDQKLGPDFCFDTPSTFQWLYGATAHNQSKERKLTSLLLQALREDYRLCYKNTQNTKGMYTLFPIAIDSGTLHQLPIQTLESIALLLVHHQHTSALCSYPWDISHPLLTPFLVPQASAMPTISVQKSLEEELVDMIGCRVRINNTREIDLVGIYCEMGDDQLRLIGEDGQEFYRSDIKTIERVLEPSHPDRGMMHFSHNASSKEQIPYLGHLDYKVVYLTSQAQYEKSSFCAWQEALSKTLRDTYPTINMTSLWDIKSEAKEGQIAYCEAMFQAYMPNTTVKLCRNRVLAYANPTVYARLTNGETKMCTHLTHAIDTSLHTEVSEPSESYALLKFLNQINECIEQKIHVSLFNSQIIDLDDSPEQNNKRVWDAYFEAYSL